MNALVNFEKSHEQYVYVWCMQFRKVSFYLRERTKDQHGLTLSVQ